MRNLVKNMNVPPYIKNSKNHYNIVFEKGQYRRKRKVSLPEKYNNNTWL